MNFISKPIQGLIAFAAEPKFVQFAVDEAFKSIDWTNLIDAARNIIGDW